MSNKIQYAFCIEKILSENQYLIPIYQRNFEWEKEEISKLILDINNFGENYYLGTLVTSKKSDDQYELIDGQQRHTTLNLIKYYLKEKLRDNYSVYNVFKKCFEVHNLNFQARKECKLFFEQLTSGTDNVQRNFKSKNLLDAINIIKNAFIEEGIKEDEFAEKFFRKTYLFRTELPENTDLNHYFEIMNNRGEQLEKHEILKAQLMEVLKNKNKEDLFSEIWDACSDMGDYIWNNLEKDFSLRIFSENFTDWNFEKFLEKFNAKTEEDKLGLNSDVDNNQKEKEIFKLDDIIDHHLISDKFSQEHQEKTSKFRSVLHFPEFLIYTYYNTMSIDGKNYDDKKLLEIFKDYVESETFIIELLKNRIYFDKCIIKQVLNTEEKNQNWGIRTYVLKEKSFDLKETAFENSKYEDKLEMLQSMFYYSTLSDNKKEWLINLLKEKPKEADKLYTILYENFRTYIQNLNVDDLYYQNFASKIFYYFEYMLWDYWKEKHSRAEDGLDPKDKDLLKNLLETRISNIVKKENKEENKEDHQNLFHTFRFRQLNSVEHLFARNNIDKIDITPEQQDKGNIINCFGNLCLISNSENSSAGKDHPEYKKDTYQNNNFSLKRLVMFQTFYEYPEEIWNSRGIIQHQNEMQALLKHYQTLVYPQSPQN
ncbi:DUF262 domain-containing protein [Chryseobacterium sp. SC28]|uniref:GmrSD restriction endonuclease domain-containing protein n=1 Tax=Chryseobacterium sp. SC28 TaxID=2268028 RepID=UPI000F6547B6|nr:DUF262 domain-containing protein [Chryseobacterium sp. SC28]RRQ45806.1 DUF262 domain-containing protein [Chryseobacterium sp. SC28]